jgi:hypothetical protein
MFEVKIVCNIVFIYLDEYNLCIIPTSFDTLNFEILTYYYNKDGYSNLFIDKDIRDDGYIIMDKRYIKDGIQFIIHRERPKIVKSHKF